MTSPFLSDYLKTVEATADIPANPVTDPGTSPEMIAFCFDAQTQTLSFWDPVNEERLTVSLGGASLTDTDDLPEGATNLYYTAARFNSAFAAKSTTDLSEGSNLYFTNERVDDRVNALLQQGANVTLTYDDGANTLTIDAAGGSSYTDEEAQDAVGGILVDSNTLDFTYTDATPAITANKKHKGALIYSSGTITGHTGAFANILWNTASYNDTWQPADAGLPQRFWLGADFTFATTDVDTTDNQITETAHGFLTGEGPVRFTSSTTLPAGIAAATNYWIIRVDDNTFKLAASRADAIAGTPVIDITTQGTGTHTCDRGAWLVVPAGVTRVQLQAYIHENASSLSGATRLTFSKEGSGFLGGPIHKSDATGSSDCVPVSAVIAVVEGDRFSAQDLGDDAYDITGGTGTGAAYFSIFVHQ